MKTTYYIGLTICSCIIASCAKSGDLSDRTNDRSDIIVSNSLKSITLGLNAAIGEDGRFPEKLSNLAEFLQVVPKEGTNAWLMTPDLNSNYFVCPGTGSIPGSISNVDEWSDYIYIGNNKDTRPDVPILISPPENHHGKYGYVVLPGQGTVRLPASEVRDLIKEPWQLATNETPDNIESIKRDSIVNVPRRL